MKKPFSRSSLRALAMLALAFFLPVAPHAADHGDAPIASNNQSTDIADVFAFLDPNDNSRLILAMTQRGFIASGENANFGIFDQFLKYRLQLETTGDAQPDLFIDITFTPVEQSGGPQTATIEFSSGFPSGPASFTALTTRSTTTTESREATLARQVVTEDLATGIKFFAGLVDDPFFFDIPAFGRFVTSARLGTPDPTLLQRGRDSFAGYNLMGIALSIPLSSLPSPSSIGLGVSGLILRNTTTRVLEDGLKTFGEFRQVERMGNPAVNVALIPFTRKDEHNFATPEDDAAGQFAADIVGTLMALGTSGTPDDPASNIGILANIVVTNGDYLRLNLATPNNSLGVGEFITDAGYAGYPNGRRLGDDTVDVLLYFITNQNTDIFPEDKSLRGDNVNSNDVPLGDTFPYFAPSQQPREPGVTDDNTRN
jgi:Domain of unknown function (DUF4331)